MKTADEVKAAIASRMKSTWAAEVYAPGSGWPTNVVLGPPKSAAMPAAWSAVAAWAKTWDRQASVWGVEVTRHDFTVSRSVQSVPTHLVVPNVDAAARILGGIWPERLRVARARVQMFGRFPEADVPRILAATVNESDVDFGLLLTSAEWFRDNETAGRTARQIPIVGIHSKWISSRQASLLRLSGRESLGLRGRPQSFNFTYLDPEYRASGLRIYDSWTVGDAEIPSYEPSTVIICENKDNALFFPSTEDAVAVEGAGFAGASVIPLVRWVRDCAHLLYWGDIDAAGFEIVNRYRSHGLDVRTVAMDRATYVEFAQFGVDEDKNGNDLRAVRRVSLPLLTDDERELYEALTDPSWAGPRRIEQERLPFPDLSVVLDGAK